MKKLVSLFVLCIPSFFYAQQKSILIIGNSYTYSNDLPFVLKSISESNGKDVYIASHSIGGATFQQHSVNSTLLNLIKSRTWDYVLIQGQSQEPSFSDYQVNTQSLPYLKIVADSVYSNNFCTDLQLFMTWGRENGDPQWGPISTYDGMQTRLYDGYMRMADSVAASVSPVGQVWRAMRTSNPANGLYVSDGSHPSYLGTYLAAATIYSTIFRELPATNSYIGNATSTFLNEVRLLIDQEVLSNLALYNLRPLDQQTILYPLEIVNNPANLTFEVTAKFRKAQQITVDYDDGSASDILNVSYNDLKKSFEHNYQVNQTQTITVKALSECNESSQSQELINGSLGMDDLMTDNQFTVSGKTILNPSNQQLIIFDLNGKKMFQSQESRIEMNLPTGIYLLQSANKAQKIYIP